MSNMFYIIVKILQLLAIDIIRLTGIIPVNTVVKSDTYHFTTHDRHNGKLSVQYRMITVVSSNVCVLSLDNWWIGA